VLGEGHLEEKRTLTSIGVELQEGKGIVLFSMTLIHPIPLIH
jgi:hypothetical protein